MIKLGHTTNPWALIVVTTLYLSCLPFFFLPALRVVCLKESCISFFWAGGNFSKVGNGLMLPLFSIVKSELIAANAWTSNVSTRRRTFVSTMSSSLLWICSRRSYISCRVSGTLFLCSDMSVIKILKYLLMVYIHAKFSLPYFTQETASCHNVHVPDSLFHFGSGV